MGKQTQKKLFSSLMQAEESSSKADPLYFLQT